MILDLHFELVWSVVLRANTSIKRRTISLQPPFDGQHINILIFFFGVPDDETVGDWSLEIDEDDVDYIQNLWMKSIQISLTCKRALTIPVIVWDLPL